MDQENQISIDINSADADSLTELQGVGARLASRIIEERPFATIDELTRVRGISEKDVDRLRPFLSISDAPERAQVLDEIDDVEEPDDTEELIANEAASEGSSSVDMTIGDQPQTLEKQVDVEEIDDFDANSDDDSSAEGQPQTVDDTEQPGKSIDDPEIEEQEPETTADFDQEPLPDELDPAQEDPTEQPVAQPVFITRGGACSLILIGGFLTMLLAVAVTLGILSSINQGRLDFASPSQITTLQSQVDTLTTQSHTLAEDIDGMRIRMDNLESLSGQVSEMETELSSQQGEIDELQVQIAANQAAYDEMVLQLEGIKEEVETLTNQSDRFESFLEGLHTLMEELFPQAMEVEEIP